MSNAMLELERECVEVVDDSLEKKFNEEVRSKLGYNVQYGKVNNKLRQTLIDLDIRPFTNKSVDRYKKQMLSPVRDRILGRVCLLGLLSMVGAAIAWGFGVVFAVSAAVFCVGLIAFVGCFIAAVATEEKREWKKTNLYGCSLEVPEFALQSALDIQAKCPNTVSFQIEYLEISKVVRDPFLIVSTSEEQYYIEVWNEPGFKQKRQA